jgi:DNA invertase Pin-like site-specific DNA recombinase
MVPDRSHKPLRVLGYVRVSTDEQARSGAGLAAQREAIERECEYRRRVLVGIIEEHNGQSAKTLDRPGMRSALERLTAGEADILMAAKLDRISRSVVDFGTVIEQARRDGWALVVLDSDIDMSTAAGKMVANVLVTFAEYERDLIVERTKRAMAAKRAQGTMRLGRPSSLSEEDTRRVVAQWEQDWTLQRIADDLNARGVPPSQGAAMWRTSAVQAVLKRAGVQSTRGRGRHARSS